MTDWVVLDLLEDSVEADDEVETVHDETDAHETDQRNLVVAQSASDTGRPVDAWHRRRRWARERVVPRGTRRGRAGYYGCEEVIEGECERGRPRANKDHLDERMCELARRPP